MGIFVTLHSKWPGSRMRPPGREEMKNQEAEKSTKTVDEIVHRALVTQVGGGYARVRISDQAECKGCAAASLCGIGDKGSEPLDVQVPTGMRVRPGDHVEIAGTERLHQKAIRLLTAYPTLAIIAVMVGMYLLTGNELAAALSAMGVMATLCVILYLCRGRIAHEFVFTLKRVLTADNQ